VPQVSLLRPGIPQTNSYWKTPTLRLVIRSDCLNSQANGGAPLQVEAADSNLSCPPGRVPHVCAGVAGALHGLNKMGAKPLPMFSFPFTEAKQREEPNNRRAERCEADLSRLPRRAVGCRGGICSSADLYEDTEYYSQKNVISPLRYAPGPNDKGERG
jgi:hypothetical protein